MKKAYPYIILMLFAFGCSTDSESDGEVLGNTDDTVVAEVMVAIPDSAFEQALIDLNFDNELDGMVNKDRIDFITELTINDEGITDLTGISEFDALVNLNVRDNAITSLDVTNNTSLLFVWAEGNGLEEVDVTGLSSLEKLGLDRNDLQEVNVQTNTGLQLLTVSENRLSRIDVSNNNALTDFTVVDNPLNCILVNEAQLNAIPTDWVKDDMDSYALDCE